MEPVKLVTRQVMSPVSEITLSLVSPVSRYLTYLMTVTPLDSDPADANMSLVPPRLVSRVGAT